MERNYLPILALNIHQLTQSLEFDAKVSLTSGSLIMDDSHDESDSSNLDMAVENWQALHRSLSTLNAQFRFPYVSQITMHNAFNAACRTCFSLDELETRLSADLAAITSHVQTVLSMRHESRQRRFRQRYRWILVIAAALIPGLVVLEYATAWQTMTEGGWTLSEKASVVLILIAIVAGGCWTYKKLRDDLR